MSDKMRVTILDDGSLKIETDKVSSANHTNAEGFIREMVRMMGGKQSVKNKVMHGHVHDEQHEHE
jgi:hypothetical protein